MLQKANLQKHYAVYTAESGTDGLLQLSSHPDSSIVLSDMKMPKMNGIEFICKARLEFPQTVRY